MGKNSELGIRRISALYDDRTIRVYQAYNNQISDEALKLGTFGPSFKTERMTWIKPSFLWMMYRSNWGTKVNQERILAIDILRDGFDEILENATLSNSKAIYTFHMNNGEKNYVNLRLDANGILKKIYTATI